MHGILAGVGIFALCCVYLLRKWLAISCVSIILLCQECPVFHDKSGFDEFLGQLRIMQYCSERMVYDSPQVEIITIEVENVIAASGENLENPVEGEESDW